MVGGEGMCGVSTSTSLISMQSITSGSVWKVMMSSTSFKIKLAKKGGCLEGRQMRTTFTVLVDCLPCKSQDEYTLPEMFIEHLCLECIRIVTFLIEALIWIQIITF